MNSSAQRRRTARRIAAVVALALALRVWAALLLPVDVDEPVYGAAALKYAAALRAGDLAALLDDAGNPEHPPLVKLVYALGALTLGEGAGLEEVRLASRAIAALAGTAAVALMGLFFGPLAAAMLAVHTLAVKYTAQAYLEAVPLLCAVLAVGAARAASAAPMGSRASRRLCCVSAVALGLAAAGKLTYGLLTAPAIVALLIGAMAGPAARPRRAALAGLAGYALLAAACFWLATPTLWRDPLGGLAAMAGFHLAYSRGADVAAAGYPWFQPLIWLGSSAAAAWHPDVFFYFGFDGLIFLLALGGMQGAWRAPGERWLPTWLGCGLAVLLLWPTKWPQYALPLVPAVCALAAPALAALVARLRELDDYWGWTRELLPRPPRYAWAALALAAAFVLGIYVYGLAGVALGSIGWSHLTPGAGPLPAGPVSDVLALPDGRVALATAQGVLIWAAPADGLEPRWEQPAGASAALGGGPALALALDSEGTLWVGGAGGLSALGPGGPVSYGAAELGGSALVRALAADAAGRLWVGTGAGAAVRDADGAWTRLTEPVGGKLVLSIALERRADGEAVWFGGVGGVSRLELSTGRWRHFGSADGFGAAGVSDLLADAQGHIWAATLGDGLGVWDGTTWRWRRGQSLPSTTLTALAEGPSGTLWIGSAASLSVGGALTRLEGDELYTFLPRNSGYNAAEPLALAVDRTGQLWVGTRGDGVIRYRPPG